MGNKTYCTKAKKWVSCYGQKCLNCDWWLNKEGAICRGIGVDGRPAFERELVMGDAGIHGFIEKSVDGCNADRNICEGKPKKIPKPYILYKE